MLAALRTNTKIILWIVVVAFLGFIFAAWGRGLQRSRSGPERGVVGRVAGVSLRYDDFSEAFRQNLKTYAERSTGQITQGIRDAIEEQTWNTMVNDVLIDSEIERLGIDVTDQHVFDLLWNNPPEMIYTSPAFQDQNGNFDFELYHREIQLHPERWEGLADYYRQALKRQLLQQEVMASAFVNDNEVWSEFVTQNEKVSATYVAIDPTTIDVNSVMPTDDEARAYFEKHRSEYELPPMVSLSFVRFPKTATEEDEQDVIARLQDLADASRDGEDFGELAKVYSEHPTASAGGDMGYVRKGMLPAEVEQAAFELAVGQISPPIKVQDGFYLVKAEDRRRSGGDTEVRVRTIFTRVRPSEQTLTTIEEAAGQLVQAAQKQGLAAAAAAEGLAVEATPPFPNEKVIPGIGNLATAVALAFQGREGQQFGPMVTDDAYYVFEIAKKLDKRLPTYEDLETEAQAAGKVNPAKLALAAERQTDRALGLAQVIASEATSGKTLEEAAMSKGYVVQRTAPFSRKDFVPGIGSGNEFIGTAFGLNVGDTAGPVRTENPVRFFVIRTEERIAANQQDFGAQRGVIEQQLLQRNRMEVLAAWMDGLKQSSEVEDFRDVYIATGGRPQAPPPSMGYGY